MRVRLNPLLSAFFLALAVLCWSASLASAADGDPWTVSKSSGEVWVTRGEMQRVALTSDAALSAGDMIRTGRNGRVLLTRGEETIVIAPNTEIGIPKPGKDGFPTTIEQVAGSIQLEVEKRNVQHFEVDTPYLAAVVKGTKFSVTVDRKGAHVDVTRGQVQVSDFKTGQSVIVLPGQSAGVSAHGAGGLQLKGSGTFNAIEQDKPRATGLRALAVPKGGLRAPHNSAKAALHGAGAKAFARADSSAGKNHNVHRTAHGGIRIDSALGEVNLDFNKVTSGLAHGAGDTTVGARSKDASGAAQNSGGASDTANASSDGSSSSSATNASASADSSAASSGGSVSASAGGSAGGGVGGSVGGSAGSSGGSSVAGAVSGASGGLGGTVAALGSTVGSTVSSVGGTAGSTVGGTLGSTVSSVTSTVGSTVSGLTSTVGGLLGGKKK
jgi:hypothetical protein